MENTYREIITIGDGGYVKLINGDEIKLVNGGHSDYIIYSVVDGKLRGKLQKAKASELEKIIRDGAFVSKSVAVKLNLLTTNLNKE